MDGGAGALGAQEASSGIENARKQSTSKQAAEPHVTTLRYGVVSSSKIITLATASQGSLRYEPKEFDRDAIRTPSQPVLGTRDEKPRRI
jgi:hypothetical protein